MDKKLKDIFRQGEGYFAEFKRKVTKEISRELVAFANASGGIIYVGIGDSGELIGIDNPNKSVSEIQNYALDCDPPVNVKTKILADNIIEITVPESKNKPHRNTQGFFLRMGANSQKMKTESIVEFIEKEGRVRFDERIRLDVDFKDSFSDENWSKFKRISKLPDDIDKVISLHSLGAIKKAEKKIYFTNAGLLFFAENPTEHLPHCYINCTAFSTNDKSTISDSKQFNGSLISNFNDAINFIERHINVSTVIEGRLSKRVFEIPEICLREGLINALIHRDYLETGAQVNVEIFPDKIRITNPGGLPKGLDKNEFGSHSLARNAIIASIMQRTPLMEKLGTGINRIKNALAEVDLPRATYNFNQFFSLEFSRVEGGQIGGQKGGHKGGLKGGHKGGHKGGLKGGHKGGLKITKRQKEVLNLILNNPRIEQEELVEILAINRSAVQKHINLLKEKGIIERKGGKKLGYWEIIAEVE